MEAIILKYLVWIIIIMFGTIVKDHIIKPTNAYLFGFLIGVATEAIILGWKV